MTEDAILPYPEPGGETYTSGHSGSDTSRERAEREDKAGITQRRQNETLAYVASFGIDGVTVVDLREITGWHHGQASSALSTLHKAGRLDRLKERRDRCAIYVHPDYTAGRETAPYKRNRGVDEARELLNDVMLLRQFGEGLGRTWQETDKKIEAYLRGQK